MKIRGHESFPIRKGWLHKGIKNIVESPRLFLDKEENPCDILGIGTNMVKALRYWLQATQLITEDRANRHEVMTNVARIIDANDKYFEEFGTNALIHYLLASNQDSATAWYWLFNEYEGKEIDKEIFISEINTYVQANSRDGKIGSEKVLSDEFSCIMRTYFAREERDDDPEETKLCPLTELKLIGMANEKTKMYRKLPIDVDSLNPLLALAIIINERGDFMNEIKINDLFYSKNNIGKIFNLDRLDVLHVLEKIAKLGHVSIIRTAGLDVVKINTVKTFEQWIFAYYESLNEEAVDNV